MKNKVIRLILSGSIYALFLTACGNSSHVEETVQLIEPISVSKVLETVQYDDINIMKVFEAYAYPENEELSFESSGRIEEINVKIGSEVKEGSVLAVLDDSQIKEDISKQKENIERLKDSYELSKKSLEDERKQKNVHREELEQALKMEGSDPISLNKELIILESDIKKIDSNLKKISQLYEIDKLIESDIQKQIEASLGNNTIIAPFDGEVIGIQSKGIGDYISGNEPLIGLANINETRITCDYISEAAIKDSYEYYLMKDNKKLPLEYIPYDKDVYAALVLREEKPVSTFIYPGNKKDMKQGDFGIVCLVEERVEQVLTLSVHCVEKDKTGNYVYIDDNGAKVKQYVVIGATDHALVEIIEGLEEGDKVYAEY